MLLPLKAVDLSATEPTWLVQLRQDVAELRCEVTQLRRDNLELRQQAGYWRCQHAAAKQQIAKLEQEVAQLRGENRKLQDQLFGRKSEKASSRDHSNCLEGEDEEPAPTEPARRGQRNRPARAEAAGLQSLAGRRGNPRVARAPAPLPRLWGTILAQRHRGFRTDRDRGPPLSPSLPAATLPTDMHLRGRPANHHRSAGAQADPQGVVGGVRVGGDPSGEVLQPLSHGAVAGLLAATRSGRGCRHRHDRPGSASNRLFQPLYDALLARNAQSAFAQADETRWMVFVVQDGKSGYQWWLWVFLGDDTVVFRLDPSRSHEVPEGHFPDDARVVVMVDRYSAYKAMAQVKTGHVVLVFCWVHVRRDFVKVGKGWEESKAWAVAWLRRIRTLYRRHHERRRHAVGSAEFVAADVEVRQTVATMQAQAETELADPRLATPCRKVLVSLQEHWPGLTRFVDDPRIPLDNNASERQRGVRPWGGRTTMARVRCGADAWRPHCSLCSRPGCWPG